MGWTFQHRDKGTTNLEWFRNEFRLDGQEGRGELLDLASTRGYQNPCYGALRTPSGEVIGIVILTQWVPNDYYNFGYKEMDETMGPYEVDCPKRIFDQLTGEPEGYAAEWRARVAARLAAKATRPKVTKGSRVIFTGDDEYSKRLAALGTLHWEKGNVFTRGIFPRSYGRIRIAGWRDVPYRVEVA